ADDLVERPGASGVQTPGAHLGGGALEHELVVPEVLDRLPGGRGQDGDAAGARGRAGPGVGGWGARLGDIGVLRLDPSVVALGTDGLIDGQGSSDQESDEENRGEETHATPTVLSAEADAHVERRDVVLGRC